MRSRSELNSMKPIHIIFALIVALCWGFNFTASKFAVVHFTPFTMTGIRYAMVALMLSPLLFKAREASLKQIFILSMLMVTLHFGLVFTGMWMGLSIASTVVAVQLGVPFSCVMSAFIYKDKLGPWRSFGMMLAFVGVLIVAGTPNVADNSFAFLLAVAGAAAWAGSNIYMKQFGQVKILPLLAWTSLLAVPQMAVMSLLLEGDFVGLVTTAPWTAWGGIFYSAIFSTLVGYGLWYYLIRHYNVSVVAPYSLLVPIAGFSGGIIFFNEPLTLQMLIGAVITVAGVAIITLRQPKLMQRVEKC